MADSIKEASIHQLADELRDRGCAVVVWTPEELGEDTDSDQLEDVVRERGNNVIWATGSNQ